MTGVTDPDRFRVAMIPDRVKVDTSHRALATVLHADGFGDPGTTTGTWNALHAAPAPPVFVSFQ